MIQFKWLHGRAENEPMRKDEVLTRAQRRLRALSPERLRVADDFLAYLAEREDNPATLELMSIPGFTKALETAERQVARGQTFRFDDVRRDV